jgi:ketosteroid isomerase-like protein
MPARDPAETDAVLLANTAFYDAFSAADFEKMSELWARESTVSCLHPGMPALHGRPDVLESWRRILAGGPGSIRGHEPKVSLFGTSALVTCYESSDAQPAHLAATNVFVLEDGRWRMVHHQAGPLARAMPITKRSDMN